MTPSKRSVSFPLWRARDDNGDSSETTTELPFEDTEPDVIHGDADEGFAIAYGLTRYVLDRTDVVALFGSDCNFDGLVVIRATLLLFLSARVCVRASRKQKRTFRLGHCSRYSVVALLI